MIEILPKTYVIELNNIDEDLILSASKNTLEFDSYCDSLVQDYIDIHCNSLKGYYWKIDKFFAGEKYSSITEDVRGKPCVISFKIFLNDDYEGGELIFDNYGYSVKPRKGMLLIHPSSYLYKYTISEVYNSTQIILSKNFYHAQSKDS